MFCLWFVVPFSQTVDWVKVRNIPLPLTPKGAWWAGCEVKIVNLKNNQGTATWEKTSNDKEPKCQGSTFLEDCRPCWEEDNTRNVQDPQNKTPKHLNIALSVVVPFCLQYLPHFWVQKEISFRTAFQVRGSVRRLTPWSEDGQDKETKKEAAAIISVQGSWKRRKKKKQSFFKCMEVLKRERVGAVEHTV